MSPRKFWPHQSLQPMTFSIIGREAARLWHEDQHPVVSAVEVSFHRTDCTLDLNTFSERFIAPAVAMLNTPGEYLLLSRTTMGRVYSEKFDDGVSCEVWHAYEGPTDLEVIQIWITRSPDYAKKPGRPYFWLGAAAESVFA